MLALITRRLAVAIALIVVASALTYALVAAAPGNVASFIAERTAGAGATRELVDKIAHDLGLDQALHVRYSRWLADAARGEWGISLRTGHPIADEFHARLPITAGLLLGGGVLALIVPLGVGVVGAISNGGVVDQGLRAAALLGASTPNFFLAAVGVLLFSVKLGWLPSFGVSGGLASWVLPWLTIAVFPASVLSRVVRVGLQELMARPFATTGFAKSQGRAAVLVREALPNLGVTFLTTFGAQFSLMLVGAIVIENVFAWQGLGTFFIEAIRFRDFPAMQACLLAFVVFFVVVNFVVDIVCLAIDPRIRRATGS